jgi:putative DNA primase/helicase
LSFDFDPAAECPQWDRFLRAIWPDDEDSIELLQEWFGLLLTRDTSLQQALLWIGPRRGGKGVAARVATALLGRSNVASPTLASLGQPFGLQSLIGAQLALLSDVRLSHHADLQTIAENLLRITGEDLVTIPRKFLADLTCTLAVRFWILSNEAPRFLDSSGALPSRFLVLTSRASFLGREDPKLTDKLLTELPGIFLWALAGLRALRDRGHFKQPESAREVISEIEAVASPVKTFLADECDLADPASEVLVKDLFAAWRRWCTANGREHAGSQQVFGRDLRSAIPHVVMRQPRISGRQMRVYVGIGLKGEAQ